MHGLLALPWSRCDEQFCNQRAGWIRSCLSLVKFRTFWWNIFFMIYDRVRDRCGGELEPRVEYFFLPLHSLAEIKSSIWQALWWLDRQAVGVNLSATTTSLSTARHGKRCKLTLGNGAGCQKTRQLAGTMLAEKNGEVSSPMCEGNSQAPPMLLLLLLQIINLQSIFLMKLWSPISPLLLGPCVASANFLDASGTLFMWDLDSPHTVFGSSVLLSVEKVFTLITWYSRTVCAHDVMLASWPIHFGASWFAAIYFGVFLKRLHTLERPSTSCLLCTELESVYTVYDLLPAQHVLVGSKFLDSFALCFKSYRPFFS